MYCIEINIMSATIHNKKLGSFKVRAPSSIFNRMDDR